MVVSIVQLIFRYVIHMLNVGVPLFTVYIIGRFIYLKWSHTKIYFKDELLHALTVFYFLCLYIITVGRPSMTFSIVMDQNRINAVPFIELMKLLDYGYVASFTYNVVGNILWFMPIGILLPMQMRKYWSIFTIAFCGFCVSLSIEMLQFIFGTGISDIDDLIINTIGTIIGYIIYKIAAIITVLRRRYEK
ncbi:MAG: hypothetical protein ATN33_03080 [Epulopiscium sp. Nele67-Bin001]|nr:MAG: hypothetical protein ATN33_03080 [Epulopiscium sp. Nele67-Bin001]